MVTSIELHLPTPVRCLESDDRGELWLKDDARVCTIYGGNKPRKLQRLLTAAQERGARRLVTVGAIGSHHVLATGLLGKSLGLPTIAIALARPYSPHAEQATKETLEAGVELVALGSARDLVSAARRLLQRGDYWIPPGGSSGLGALGYLDAARELKQQIDAGELPKPDAIVVALGSGGTAAGLLAGIASLSLDIDLVAVSVLHFPFARQAVLALARSAIQHQALRVDPGSLDRLTIDSRWVGKGYGHATAAGELAMRTASSLGLSLEGTYTAKAFACALALLRGPEDRGNVAPLAASRRRDSWLLPNLSEGRRILFWSTFSGVPIATPIDRTTTLPPALRRLFYSP